MDDTGVGDNRLDDLYAHKATWLHSKVRGFHDSRSDATQDCLSIIEHNLPPAVLNWDVDSDGTWRFTFKHFDVYFHPSCHSSTFLTSEIVLTSFDSTTISSERLRDEIDDLTILHLSQHSKFRDLTVLILLILEHISPNNPELTHENLPVHKMDNQDTDQVSEEYDPQLEVSSEMITDYEILGNDLSVYLNLIPDEYDVLEIEPVRSNDLTRSWREFQQELKLNANKEKTKSLKQKCHPHMKILEGQNVRTMEKEELAEEMIKPFLTFHGTSRRNVPSIIKHGFLMPGTVIGDRTIASPRSGAVFKRGIYSSPSAEFALSFSKCHQNEPVEQRELPGLRLFVCATLMGRTYTGPFAHGELRRGYDAHTSGQFEYIVHDPRAILPCYVIHLDLNTERAQKAILKVQQNPRLARFHKQGRAHLAPGDLQREEAAKKQAALKWFPYGYGPSTGTQFKVEEIGPVDDDEEPHGRLMYQSLSKTFGRNYGRVLTWMDLIQEDDGMLIEMFREEAGVDDSDQG